MALCTIVLLKESSELNLPRKIRTMRVGERFQLGHSPGAVEKMRLDIMMTIILTFHCLDIDDVGIDMIFICKS
jgi:hypothetical protein